jgi:diguanylate cyclase (GGDEF)-like protein
MFGPMDRVPPPPQRPRWTPWQRIYAAGLFAVGATAVGFSVASDPDAVVAQLSRIDAAFFLVYGLFTIAIGYHHPRVGYYSFDRVAQVASILVLGPIPAACVNGLASFLYPWHRLARGVPIQDVIFAALNNSGLMALIVLISGTAYTSLGGAVPLVTLDVTTALLLLALVVTMQAANDLGMFGLLVVGRRSTNGFLQWFSVGLELSSSMTAVLVALVYNTSAPAVLGLLLAVLTVGMVGLRQFARMRQSLERIVADRTLELQEKSAALELLATHDNLTGLFNRRHADGYLERMLGDVGENQRKLTIALADIDFFKQVNDRHSHITGDEVLKRVAKTLSGICRPTDMIARYGGEEFLICFPDTDLLEGVRICERLRAAVEGDEWTALGLASAVTISFGVAERQRDSSPRTLRHAADLRLYQAKTRGRNRVIAAA